MTESMRKKLVYGISALAVLWAVFNLPGRQRENLGSSDQSTSQQPLVASEVNRVPDKLIDIEFYEDLDWGPDPFRMRAKAKVKKPEVLTTWDLTGIVYAPGHPLAVINKTTVGVGDMVDNAKVVEIDRKQVTLDYRGSQIILTVSKG